MHDLPPPSSSGLKFIVACTANGLMSPLRRSWPPPALSVQRRLDPQSRTSLGSATRRTCLRCATMRHALWSWRPHPTHARETILARVTSLCGRRGPYSWGCLSRTPSALGNIARLVRQPHLLRPQLFGSSAPLLVLLSPGLYRTFARKRETGHHASIRIGSRSHHWLCLVPHRVPRSSMGRASRPLPILAVFSVSGVTIATQR